jgi:hypothetical protein
VCECDPIYVVFIPQAAFDQKPSLRGCYDDFGGVFAAPYKAHYLADFAYIIPAEDFRQLF